MKAKLKIGALDWTFSDLVSDTKMGNDMGECDYANLEIKIKKNLSDDIKRVTTWHELCHALFYAAGYTPKDEENIVDVLAHQIVMFIDNNPKFIKKLLKK